MFVRGKGNNNKKAEKSMTERGWVGHVGNKGITDNHRTAVLRVRALASPFVLQKGRTSYIHHKQKSNTGWVILCMTEDSISMRKCMSSISCTYGQGGCDSRLVKQMQYNLWMLETSWSPAHDRKRRLLKKIAPRSDTVFLLV